MAVGRGSMERAAKAAGTDTTLKDVSPSKRKASATAVASKAPVSKVQAAKEVEGKIVYQKSSGMLERAAEPNERFGLGDAMPVYYF